MSENEDSEEFIENLKENVFDMYFDDELEKKGLERSDLEKGQVLLRTPFANTQFEEMNLEESDAEVRINDDAEIIWIVELRDDREFEEGEEVTINDMNEIQDVMLKEEDADAGHITYDTIEGVGELFSFDFRRNQSYRRPLLEASDQFIELAEHAIEIGLWRGFVENAFHAAERMMKIDVITFGFPAETHSQVQSGYRRVVKMNVGNEDLYGVFNQLKDKYRLSASYVDPRDSADEKNFKLDKDTAESYLDILKKHHDTLENNVQQNWSTETDNSEKTGQ